MESIHENFEWVNYRIMLHNLTEEQKSRIIANSNARRYLYNWALEICNEHYTKFGKIPNYQEISRFFTKFKKLPENEWLDRINVTTCRYAFKDLTNAFHKFIIGMCKHPIFKSRKTDSIRFAIRDDTLSFKGDNGRFAFIPGISAKRGDLIDCGNHNIPHYKGIKYNNVRIKFDGVNYWLSLSVKIYKDAIHKECTNKENILGIDVGVRTAATLSNGKSYDRVNRDRLKVLENRREKIQSAVDKDRYRRKEISISTRTKYYDIPKSKNQVKREHKLAKTMIQIQNLHKSYYHKISKEISNMGYDVIVLESLNIGGAIRNSMASKMEIYESRMSTLAEYIEYKCARNGSIVIRADQHYPSSQICSNCGNRHRIGSSKIYRCEVCGISIDRDLNAAINLKNYGISAMFAV